MRRFLHAHARRLPFALLLAFAAVSCWPVTPLAAADLVITGVVGLRPRADDSVEISPLLPAETWNWFCLDGVKYHGRTLTIIWDKDGTRYHRGKGLIVLADGKEIARGNGLSKIAGKLP